ncbi:hypothetical protein [Brevundimonas sp.]|jgi:hypothetical protein|uniref:hypothetical protein n=1 Tax=Brevundimonas sp. TaxID=1871086 RepID=UPI002D1FB31C|nr:hypothetical protein [Brevundimonas sp.]
MGGAHTAPWQWLIALVVVSALLGGVLAVASNAAPGLGLGALILAVVLVIALAALGGWLISIYWHQIDEAAREAHKWAWYWGGNVALLPLMMGLAVLLQTPDAAVPLWPGLEANPAGYVATGGMAVISTLLIGYALAWLYWWLWKSR